MSASTPGLAAGHALECQVTAFDGTMRLQGTDGVHRASWLETARRTQRRTQQQAVRLDDGDQKTRHHADTCGLAGGQLFALANSCCNSWRTAAFNASEVALKNSLRSKALRSRTTWAAQAMEEALRVTARLAQRLGTMAPSQTSDSANKGGPTSANGSVIGVVSTPPKATPCRVKCCVRDHVSPFSTAWNWARVLRRCKTSDPLPN